MVPLDAHDPTPAGCFENRHFPLPGRFMGTVALRIQVFPETSSRVNTLSIVLNDGQGWDRQRFAISQMQEQHAPLHGIIFHILAGRQGPERPGHEHTFRIVAAH